MQNEQSEAIKHALSRAIECSRDNSLRAAAQQLASEDSLTISDAEGQFPFARSTD
jgi:hypothetical protein